MTLIDRGLFSVTDKVAVAIDRLRYYEPKDQPYFLAFSGGKDSTVILDLAKRAGVKYEAYYNLTTVDPPELVRFIRNEYPDVIWNKPKHTMWQLIVKNRMPPTRIARYCCRELKEQYGAGRTIITGVRWAESAKRSSRNLYEGCYTDGSKHFLHVVIDWSDDDVWEYIRSQGLPYCTLYDEGFKRIGCIMCPQSRRKLREEQVRRWPKYKDAYLRAFGRCVDKMKADGIKSENWNSAEDMYRWWMQDSHAKNKDQTVMFFE